MEPLKISSPNIQIDITAGAIISFFILLLA
jgi:hypothetical protein